MGLKDVMNRASAVADAMVTTARTKQASEHLVAGPSVGYGSNTPGLKRERLKHFTSWPAAVVRVAAQKIASQPLMLAKKVAKADPKSGKRVKTAPTGVKKLTDEAELLEQHEVLDWLHQPNEFMNWWSLVFLSICSLELSGEAYWWICRDDPERPVIWYLSADWVEPIHTEQRLFDSYRVLVYGTGHHIDIPRDDMVRFSVPDVKNPYAGALSNLQLNALACVTDEHLQVAQQKAFANGLMPGVGIVVGRHPDVAGVPGQKPILTKEQRASMTAAIKQAYRGVQNAGEPVILDGLIDDIKTLTTTPTEMGFMESSKLTKERITQGFLTNPVVMGQLENVNRASATVAAETWIEHKINPVAEMVSATLTHDLCPKLGHDGLLLWIEPATANDPDQKRADLDQLAKYGAMTVNELRDARGLPPIDGGDVLIEPGVSLTALGQEAGYQARTFPQVA